MGHLLKTRFIKVTKSTGKDVEDGQKGETLLDARSVPSRELTQLARKLAGYSCQLRGRSFPWLWWKHRAHSPLVLKCGIKYSQLLFLSGGFIKTTSYSFLYIFQVFSSAHVLLKWEVNKGFEKCSLFSSLFSAMSHLCPFSVLFF